MSAPLELFTLEEVAATFRVSPRTMREHLKAHPRGSAALVLFLTVAGVEFAEFQQNPLMKSRRLESTLDAALYVVGRHPGR
jgi:hypothetical protein